MKHAIKKRIEQIRVGQVPEGYVFNRFVMTPLTWVCCKLQELCSKSNEKNIKNLVSIVYTNSAVHGMICQNDFFDKEIANEDNLGAYYIIQPNDFIYNPRISSTAPCGPISCHGGNNIGLVSPLYCVFRAINSKNSPFLNQYFLSNYWHKYMHSIANYGVRSDRMNIKDVDFFQMPIYLPDTENEQQKIAEVLITWDKSIELKEKLIEKLETRKKALMQKLLTPKVGYSKYKLADLGYTYNGLSGKVGEDFGAGDPYIPYKNIFKNMFIDTNDLDYVKIHDEETQNLVLKNDILFTTSSETVEEVGLSSVLLTDIKLYLNSFCFGYRLFSQEHLNSFFAAYYFRSYDFRKKVMILAQGFTRINISKNELLKADVIIPNIDTQQHIAAILSTADKEIELYKRELKKLKLQKKSLMQLLLTGIVRTV